MSHSLGQKVAADRPKSTCRTRNKDGQKIGHHRRQNHGTEPLFLYVFTRRFSFIVCRLHHKRCLAAKNTMFLAVLSVTSVGSPWVIVRSVLINWNCDSEYFAYPGAGKTQIPDRQRVASIDRRLFHSTNDTSRFPSPIAKPPLFSISEPPFLKLPPAKTVLNDFQKNFWTNDALYASKRKHKRSITCRLWRNHRVTMNISLLIYLLNILLSSWLSGYGWSTQPLVLSLLIYHITDQLTDRFDLPIRSSPWHLKDQLSNTKWLVSWLCQ